VTRGTRPKKPSSSRGFARGTWGSWGLKTENCLVLLHNLQSSFTSQNLTQYFISDWELPYSNYPQFYSLTCTVTFRREKEKKGGKKLSIVVLISGPSYSADWSKKIILLQKKT
jgi:hypothetical protein